MIDPASELVMLNKQIQELSHRLSTTPTQQPGPLPQPTTKDPTVVFLPVIKELAEEFRLLRNTDNIPLKSYKNITDDVPLNFVMQDWERWFEKNFKILAA